jgi:voltage-gated potassium channel Kch
MVIIATLLGATLIVVTLVDIFNVLFHPLGSGRVSRILVRFTWRLFRYFGTYRHSVLELAGPSAVFVVIGGWVALLTVGWALIYWPHLSSGEFMFASGLDPSTHSGIIDSLYLSMTTITTLGYGDITPTSTGFRMLAPLEAMVGFGLLTASLSWVISIYQVLRRRRTLALEIKLLYDEQSATGLALAQMDPMVAQQVLDSLGSQLRIAWNDLVQFPITYYFTSSDSQTALSVSMLYLLLLAKEGMSVGCSPEVRLRASMLHSAIHVFTTLLTNDFLKLSPSTPAKEVLEAYAFDHLQVPQA